MSAWPFATDVEVRFNECDPAGHVNNAVYLTYFEAARFAYWRRTALKRGWRTTVRLKPDPTPERRRPSPTRRRRT